MSHISSIKVEPQVLISPKLSLAVPRVYEQRASNKYLMFPVEYSSFSFNQTQMWSSLPATCTPQGCHTVGGTEFHEQPSQTPWSASTNSIPRPFTLETSPLVSSPTSWCSGQQAFCFFGSFLLGFAV